ncbi:MAG: PVC-type heme-binding CxxCH protein [Pseudomonadota bacterium]
MRLTSFGFLLCLVPLLGLSQSLAYRVLDTNPAPELTPQQAAKTFRIAPGFRLELVAAEPLVEDPVAISWDRWGALYVAEMRGYMPDVYGTGQKEPVGSVVRLRDTDADGVFDERMVLMDQLVLPRAVRMVPQGLLVAEPPNLWLCPRISDSQEVDCDSKVSLGEYGNQPGSVEHAENGLILGLDNWLYSAKSTRRLKIDEKIGGQQDRSFGLIEEPTLFRGQWGIAQDNFGRLAHNTNSNLLFIDLYSAQATIAAGLQRGPGLPQDVTRGMQLNSIRVNPGVNRAYVPGVLRPDGRLGNATSASGMTIYRDSLLPLAEKGYPDEMHAFVAEPAANAIVHLSLSETDGVVSARQRLYADEQWGQREFLASTDERFRPVDVQVGPDGALYIVDMYRGIIQDHVFLSDELRAQILQRKLDKPLGLGRIWKVVAEDTDARAVPDLPAMEPRALVDMLTHPNGVVRDQAQSNLVHQKLNRATRRALHDMLTGQNEVAAVHALWTLEGAGALVRRNVARALGSGAENLRVAALRAGRSLLTEKALLTEEKHIKSRQVRLAWLDAVAQQEDKAAFFGLLSEYVNQHADDAYVSHALQTAVRGSELAFIRHLTAAKRDAASSSLVQKLVTQGVNLQPDRGVEYLDFANSQDRGDLFVAVMSGLDRLNQKDGFDPILLQEPHAVFDVDQDDWQEVSGARRVFTWPGDTLSQLVKPLSPEHSVRAADGKAVYQAQCAACHGPQGAGIGALGPQLVDSKTILDAPEWAARIILHGLQGPLKAANGDWNSVMPGHGHLPDFDASLISGLLTYLRQSWGHTQYPIFPDLVQGVMDEIQTRRSPWTMAELQEVEQNTYYRRYAGTYAMPGGGLKFYHADNVLNIGSGIFNGPLTQVAEDAFLFAPRGLYLEFVGAPGGLITGVRMRIESGFVTLPRIGD